MACIYIAKPVMAGIEHPVKQGNKFIDGGIPENGAVGTGNAFPN